MKLSNDLKKAARSWIKENEGVVRHKSVQKNTVSTFQGNRAGESAITMHLPVHPLISTHLYVVDRAYKAICKASTPILILKPAIQR